MGKDRGWIKLHRKIMESPMYLQMNSKQRDVMLCLLLMANHQEKEWLFNGVIYKVKPGQFVCSLEKIKEKCAKDVSIRNIRTSLKVMETYQFLTNESTNRNRLITICKWEEYQSEVTNYLAGNRQATDKQLTTNKNVNNNKKEELDTNVSNEQSSSEKPPRIDKRNPTVQEIWDYWEELYGTKPDGTAVKNRQAISTLIKRHGVENLKDRMTVIHESRGEPYFPGIFSFMDMRDGENKIQQYFIRVKK